LKMARATLFIRLHGHLWRYEPLGRAQVELPWKAGKTLAEWANDLGVPQDQIMVALVNGEYLPLAGCPGPGDRVELLPVIDGG
jgi:sulfur carrier protein ThiS